MKLYFYALKWVQNENVKIIVIFKKAFLASIFISKIIINIVFKWFYHLLHWSGFLVKSPVVIPFSLHIKNIFLKTIFSYSFTRFSHHCFFFSFFVIKNFPNILSFFFPLDLNGFRLTFKWISCIEMVFTAIKCFSCTWMFSLHVCIQVVFFVFINKWFLS